MTYDEAMLIVSRQRQVCFIGGPLHGEKLWLLPEVKQYSVTEFDGPVETIHTYRLFAEEEGALYWSACLPEDPDGEYRDWCMWNWPGYDGIWPE